MLVRRFEKKPVTEFEGWSRALSEMNYSRTGVMVEKMLNVSYLSDEDIESGSGLAGKIDAVTNPARQLDLG